MYGRIAFLVNNAGRTKHFSHKEREALDTKYFVDTYRLNIIAPFQMVRAVRAAATASPFGAVVNVASVAGHIWERLIGCLHRVQRSGHRDDQKLARVLAPTIRVNAVAPGYVGTGWFERIMGADQFDQLNRTVAAAAPMAMAPNVDDISGPIVMLLDPSSRVMTGEAGLFDAGAHLDVGLSRRPDTAALPTGSQVHRGQVGEAGTSKTGKRSAVLAGSNRRPPTGVYARCRRSRGRRRTARPPADRPEPPSTDKLFDKVKQPMPALFRRR